MISAPALGGKLVRVDAFTTGRLQEFQAGKTFVPRSSVTCVVKKSVQLGRFIENTVDLENCEDQEVLAQAINDACVGDAKKKGTLWIRTRNEFVRLAVCQALEKEKLVGWYEEKCDRLGVTKGKGWKMQKQYESRFWIRAHLRP